MVKMQSKHIELLAFFVFLAFLTALVVATVVRGRPAEHPDLIVPTVSVTTTPSISPSPRSK